MLRVVIKNVVSVSCINRVFNADDILRRSLNEGFIDAKDGGHYKEDNEIKALKSFLMKNSLVNFDEIHAYDSETFGLIKSLNIHLRILSQ
jgi:hypothetical protein